MSFSRSSQKVIVLLCLFFQISCSNSDTLFTSLSSSDTGVTFNNTLFEDGALNVSNYIYFYNGGGVSIGDINNDGLQDVLFTGNMVRNRLYLNKGNFEFEDITKQSGIADLEGWCTGANMEDVNGDGKIDIYICRSADINPEMRKNLLFINNGDLSFTEKAAEYGLADTGYSTHSSFFDYDKDGDLDCFVINHSVSKYTAGVQDNPELRNEKNSDYASRLYRNDNNKYTDVSQTSGISSNVLTFGLGLAISDFNNDGWPDVVVSNDFNEPDYFFQNNGNGTFTEKLSETMDNISLYSMGSDAADYDNDGNVDFMTLDMMPEDNKTIKMHSGAENFDKFQFLFKQGFYYQYSRNMLQHNNGDGTFSEVGQLAGVSNSDWSWAALFSDYDNDGHKDLFVTNGYVKDYTEMDFLKYSVDRVVKTMAKDSSADPIPVYLSKMPQSKIPNYAFRNNGNGTFDKKSKEWGFGKSGVSAGAAYADLDNDGDLDLVVNNTNEISNIFRNNTNKNPENNYLKVKLEGNQGNSRGLGTKVKLYTKGTLLYQEQSTSRGFQSSSDPNLNFGLGKAANIDSIIIIWPNNKSETIKNVKANQTLTVKQINALKDFQYVSSQKPLITHESSTIKHVENKFNDFTVQSLLPNYLSRQGPSMASADINGDGTLDLFIGGAKGQASALYSQSKSGALTATNAAVFEADKNSEDVSACFADIDKDGDQDLYVASGGYEFAENDALLQDRIYLNDGRGNFSKKMDALPQMLTSKGIVKANDIDKDGDIDFFVGTRLTPGKYPLSASSYILLNNGKGTFTISNSTALLNLGMVTSAEWIDVNKDSYPDLVVAGEFMPIKVLINKKGTLSDQSEVYAKFPSSGLWNTLVASDMEGDGDLDLIAGNQGLNNQFKVKETEPITVHGGDFGGGGSTVPIVSYYIQGVSYPMASRDDMADPLPFIKKKFNDYKSFSEATLSDIFDKDQLSKAIVLSAGEMNSLYLENKGSTGFVPHTLPIQAQYAPVYSILAKDFNKDGKKDLLLMGNNTWTRIKLGRYAANHGTLLLGNAKGDFSYVTQANSGLKLRGNVRNATILNETQAIVGFNDQAAEILKF